MSNMNTVNVNIPTVGVPITFQEGKTANTTRRLKKELRDRGYGDVARRIDEIRWNVPQIDARGKTVRVTGTIKTILGHEIGTVEVLY